MKRIFSLIIMVLYLLPALGMTVSTHYCGGKLADVSLFGSKPKMSCACGAMASKNKVHIKKKCCEQVTFSLKLDNQQLKQSTLDHKSPNAEILAEKQFDFGFIRNTIIVMPKVALSYSPNLPPGRYKEPIYIQNDSFLI
ncbi:MAG: HYC_CC_PP family protein [Fluviicola sp.]|uniref:HYC_CC_PP family protein n=1 Tax=uncultured Fluviicola sp. TaxID=463303 RepID=UPI0025EC0F7F|nr:hypothetical protein [uncultured Fluviicola sp.]